MPCPPEVRCHNPEESGKKPQSHLVARHLEEKGLRRAPSVAAADYAVFIRYAIDDGRTSVSSAPGYGQTGGGTVSTTTGYVGRTAFSGTTYTPPTFGVTGYEPIESTIYGRAVRIDTVDVRRTVAEKKAATVYEVTATSAGLSGTLNVVLPSMIDAIFVDWPGKSGATHTRRLRLH